MDNRNINKIKWKNPTNTLTYNSWRSMRNRCLYNNENAKHYKNKGILICDEWINDYDKFIDDLGHRPINTTLDRINSSGNYEPSNCRWAIHREQQNNKPYLTQIEHDGIIKTIGEWAYDLDYDNNQLTRAYKRYSCYGAITFEELFYDGSLLTKRVNERINTCKICNNIESIKWRKYGELCNTCYHKALRWSKKTQQNIEDFQEWKGITWKTKY